MQLKIPKEGCDKIGRCIIMSQFGLRDDLCTQMNTSGRLKARIT